jgi:hypothetical protein
MTTTYSESTLATENNIHDPLSEHIAVLNNLNDTDSTTCSITNNSGDAIVIVDAFNTDSSSSAQCYAQTLKILPTSTGSQTLADKATATITLNDTFTYNGQQEPQHCYQLLISRPNSLFPVMDVSEILDSSAQTYPSITVTAAAAKNMKLALNFQQNIMAYPTSSMATSFAQAMNQAASESSVTAMEQDIADFFNSTENYKGLDLDSYIAMASYLSTFAWLWGIGDDGKTPGRTYYVYKSAGETGSTSIGKVVFTQAARTPDPNDHNSGFTITYIPSSGSSSTLHFNNNTLVNDLKADFPNFCVQGNFALKSTFTGNTNDNIIWPIFSGQISGEQVLLVSDAPSTESWWQQHVSSKTWKDWLHMLMTVGSLVMMVEYFWKKVSAKKRKMESDEANENKGKSLTEEQIKDADNLANSVGEQTLSESQTTLNQLGSGVQMPTNQESFNSTLASAKQEQINVNNEMQADTYTGIIDEYTGQIDELAKIAVNPDIENAMNCLEKAQTEVNQGQETGDFDFAAIQSNLNSVNQSLTQFTKTFQKNINQATQKQLEESQKEISDYEDTIDNIEKNNEDIDNDESPFDDDGIENPS